MSDRRRRGVTRAKPREVAGEVVLRVNPSGTHPPEADDCPTHDIAMDPWGLRDHTFEHTLPGRRERPHGLRETIVTVLGAAALLGLVALLFWVLAHQVEGSLDSWANKLGELVDKWSGP